MPNIYIYVLCMAVTTYLIRVLPLVLFKKEIKSNFIKSFLYYVPYACLATMTFPAMITSTSYLVSGILSFVVALYLGYKEKSLLSVAISACVVVFIVERIIEIL